MQLTLTLDHLSHRCEKICVDRTGGDTSWWDLVNGAVAHLLHLSPGGMNGFVLKHSRPLNAVINYIRITVGVCPTVVSSLNVFGSFLFILKLKPCFN